jgi:DnaK suppressor protein
MTDDKKHPKTKKTTPKASADKKVAAKARPAPAKPVLAAKTKKSSKNSDEEHKALTDKDLEYFRQLLLEKRRELIGDVDHMRDGALQTNRQESTGELSTMPIHMADVGTDNYEQEFTLGLIESERKMLRDIDRALAKINEGGYGICEGTGQPIARSRLEARPEARYCIEYAREMEKGVIKTTPLEDDRDQSEDAIEVND